jgi:hypothetical protein
MDKHELIIYYISMIALELDKIALAFGHPTMAEFFKCGEK